MYTMRTRVGDTNIYVYRTRGKAIIGMALLKDLHTNIENVYKKITHY